MQGAYSGAVEGAEQEELLEGSLEGVTRGRLEVVKAQHVVDADGLELRWESTRTPTCSSTLARLQRWISGTESSRRARKASSGNKRKHYVTHPTQTHLALALTACAA